MAVSAMGAPSPELQALSVPPVAQSAAGEDPLALQQAQLAAQPLEVLTPILQQTMKQPQSSMDSAGQGGSTPQGGGDPMGGASGQAAPPPSSLSGVGQQNGSAPRAMAIRSAPTCIRPTQRRTADARTHCKRRRSR
jgi:hypothetical protein